MKIQHVLQATIPGKGLSSIHPGEPQSNEIKLDDLIRGTPKELNQTSEFPQQGFFATKLPDGSLHFAILAFWPNLIGDSERPGVFFGHHVFLGPTPPAPLELQKVCALVYQLLLYYTRRFEDIGLNAANVAIGAAEPNVFEEIFEHLNAPIDEYHAKTIAKSLLLPALNNECPLDLMVGPPFDPILGIPILLREFLANPSILKVGGGDIAKSQIPSYQATLCSRESSKFSRQIDLTPGLSGIDWKVVAKPDPKPKRWNWSLFNLFGRFSRFDVSNKEKVVPSAGPDQEKIPDRLGSWLRQLDAQLEKQTSQMAAQSLLLERIREFISDAKNEPAKRSSIEQAGL